MESGKTLTGARVELFRYNISLTKKLTDCLRDYSILLGVNTGKLIAKISKLGYELIVINVDLRKADEENKVALEVARLKPKAILLNEVVIKRSKKYRDTTVIDLFKETFKRFVMIDDLFSRKGFQKVLMANCTGQGRLSSVKFELFKRGTFTENANNKADIYDMLVELSPAIEKIIKESPFLWKPAYDKKTKTSVQESSTFVIVVNKTRLEISDIPAIHQMPPEIPAVN